MSSGFTKAVATLTGFGLYLVASKMMAPYHAINLELKRVKRDWAATKECQSINDKLAAGKMTRAEYQTAMHTGPARYLWVRLTLSFPHQQKYIAERIRETYPHAEKWS